MTDRRSRAEHAMPLRSKAGATVCRPACLNGTMHGRWRRRELGREAEPTYCEERSERPNETEVTAGHAFSCRRASAENPGTQECALHSLLLRLTRRTTARCAIVVIERDL